jgi:hypothetical protein
LDGKWLGIVGGTNIGKVSVSFQQTGNQVSGQFTFQDLVLVPLRADFFAVILSRRLIDGGLQRFVPLQAIPQGLNLPSSGRMLGIIEEDGRKISGFWITNVGTGGGFAIFREQ